MFDDKNPRYKMDVCTAKLIELGNHENKILHFLQHNDDFAQQLNFFYQCTHLTTDVNTSQFNL